MVLEWNDVLLTGIEEIDNQHKELFDGINKLGENYSDNSQIWGTILLLQNYAYIHFDTEEKYMKENYYPDFKEHKAEHDLFLKKFKAIKLKLNDLTLEELRPELIKFVANWITTHYSDHDVKMAKFIKENLYKIV